MYLPLMAIAAGAVVVAHRLIGGRRGVGMAIVVTLAVALGTLTIRRNALYASEVTIWRDSVARRPNNLRALSEYARVLQAAGRAAEARQVAERVVALDPSYPGARATLGALLIGAGDLDAAVAHLRAAVERDPKDALARTNLGLAMWRKGDADAAIAHYRAALQLDPNFVDAHVYLADALAARGQVVEARAHLETAMKLQPDAPDIRAAYQRLKSQ
jgi:tetratricopeptide (TPR) repeat protein